MSDELPGWVVPGAPVMWLHKGLATVDRVQLSAGERFVVVTPRGWNGEPGWVTARGVALHLRPLVDDATCARWMAVVRASPVRRTGGDLSIRRMRHQRIAERGDAEQQVAALCEAYAEAHRPDAADVALLEHLERMVVFEIAAVLGRDADELRAELCAGRPRFGEGAPRSGQIVEEPPAPPPLAPELRWFATFASGGELAITDLDTIQRVPALAGSWHAAWFDPPCDDDDPIEPPLGWVVFADAHRARVPLELATGRLLHLTDGYAYPLAVLDGPAADDPMVEDELGACMTHEVDGRGAASFWRRRAEVRVWEEGGQVFAIALTTAAEPDDEREEEEEDEAPPPAWMAWRALAMWPGRAAMRIDSAGWSAEDGRRMVVARPVDDYREIVRLTVPEALAHLRQPVDRVDAERALAIIAGGPSTAAPLTSDASGFAADVARLLAAYGAPERPRSDEAEPLMRVERPVLTELACVLELDRAELRSRCRAAWPRFSAAPSSAPGQGAVTLPADHRWIASFEVAGSLQITDLTQNTLSVPAQRGTWHAAWRDDGGGTSLVVIASGALAGLPLAAADVDRVSRVDGGRDFPLAVLDSRALQDALVATALTEAADVDVLGRGVAWISTAEPLEVRLWSRDGVCVAVEVAPA